MNNSAVLVLSSSLLCCIFLFAASWLCSLFYYISNSINKLVGILQGFLLNDLEREKDLASEPLCATFSDGLCASSSARIGDLDDKLS
ncbi:hypothetical protein V1517DRAFT_84163 [Lipomyces orientalis]|uniref:Uncharacterized protein n=1 Tax=Lipomyces orientalis TaxID=1233043 RepID=A0ACC3TRX6_9ASCO